MRERGARRSRGRRGFRVWPRPFPPPPEYMYARGATASGAQMRRGRARGLEETTMVGGAREAWNGSTVKLSANPTCQWEPFCGPGPRCEDEWSSRGWRRTVVAFSTGFHFQSGNLAMWD
jgi:hypothetical protein